MMIFCQALDYGLRSWESISVRQCWALWIGLINALFNHTRSKCKLILALSTKMKLLHHSDISFTPNGTIICCFSCCSSFSFSGFAAHRLLFLVVPDMDGLPLSLVKKKYFEEPYNRERVIKFIVYCTWDCFTHSFFSASLLSLE